MPVKFVLMKNEWMSWRNLKRKKIRELYLITDIQMRKILESRRNKLTGPDGSAVYRSGFACRIHGDERPEWEEEDGVVKNRGDERGPRAHLVRWRARRGDPTGPAASGPPKTKFTIVCSLVSALLSPLSLPLSLFLSYLLTLSQRVTGCSVLYAVTSESNSR